MIEFDDIDDSHLPMRSSKKARMAMTTLARANKLEFTHNPGGGEFYSAERGRCQISMMDDIEDYQKLCEFLGIDDWPDEIS
jgi:hypothetical protein